MEERPPAYIANFRFLVNLRLQVFEDGWVNHDEAQIDRDAREVFAASC
jgi:hypothetical protein